MWGGEGKTVEYTVNGNLYEGYVINQNRKAPLVLLIHDWDGLTDYEIKRSRMLAELGYSVFAMDLFGAGVRPTEINDKRRLTGELYKDREKMRSLMKGALEKARSLGGDTGNAMVAGYCFGGAAVLEWARSGESLKGFISFHGGLKTPEGQDYSNTKGRILVMHGTADKVVSMDEFAALAKQLESDGIKHEMITYSGAPHAFTVFGSQRYQEEADKASWKRFTDFLKMQLKQ
ncbi:dienelactone hydrolase family protein [Desulfobacter hydrogenophilus]|uniref:Dienelactone hydrolase family protein n=2 Tax=Desulfobacter hydrogenophilus TaxID=2291 RepID=A0A328FEJ1_9BACT|nr:dienelactone hydrolase family protein [Desulfobacter hydrogenophilus]NDY70911.1 dienelactone hydrolase family protein [Desulfobacter hydrogenophilus]QBH15545.1 dienelactone hydrolase family protein [Desulfobacter hydrogenophilus]RAM03101.1 dienelactone hydrolase family protein [Desulfobacter hydrogenophilus]